MIHILLLILKIIGLILLAALGILLLLVLSFLFVPVRYKVEGSWHGELKAHAAVYWLFHFLSLKAVYGQDGLTWTLRILGFRLGKKKKEDLARSVEDGAETVLDETERRQYKELEQDESAYRKAKDKKAEDQKGSEQDQEDISTDRPDTKQPWFERRWQRIRDKVEKLIGFIRRFAENAEGAAAFIQNKKAWLEDGKNQASIRLLWKQTRRLITHIWPGKGSCSITFGFEDPYATGQVLQAASLIYPYYHRQLSLRPVFDEKVLDVEGRLKGRVRLAFVLWLAIQIYWDKHTRIQIRGFIK